jgi:hypothetical protein
LSASEIDETFAPVLLAVAETASVVTYGLRRAFS